MAWHSEDPGWFPPLIPVGIGQPLNPENKTIWDQSRAYHFNGDTFDPGNQPGATKKSKKKRKEMKKAKIKKRKTKKLAK